MSNWACEVAVAAQLLTMSCTPATPPVPPPVATALTMLLDVPPPPGVPGNASIYAYRTDTGTKTLLTNDGHSPSYTPDGRVIFMRNNHEIWIMGADGSTPWRVATSNLTTLMPQLGRNGALVFMDVATDADGNSGIYQMNQDGSGRLIARGFQPSLAVSGTWLTYTVQTMNPQHREIWRINLDGTGQKQLTFTGDPDYPDANASSISPDETMVAYFSGTEATNSPDPSTWGYRNVAVTPANGGARRTLTPCQPISANNPTQCIAADNPAWTPDGKSIIGDTGWRDHGDTFIVDLNGQNFKPFYSASRGTVKVPLK